MDTFLSKAKQNNGVLNTLLENMYINKIKKQRDADIKSQADWDDKLMAFLRA